MMVNDYFFLRIEILFMTNSYFSNTRIRSEIYKDDQISAITIVKVDTYLSNVR